MKKFVAWVLFLVLILSLAGCGVKEQLEKKAGEALAEKMIEGAGGGKVDIDGEKVTIKGEGGAQVTVGGTEWPKSELAKSAPEFKQGEISGIYDSEDSVMVALESVKEADARAYLETIKKTFTQEPVEMIATDCFSFGANNANGINVTLQYSDGTLTITLMKVETK